MVAEYVLENMDKYSQIWTFLSPFQPLDQFMENYWQIDPGHIPLLAERSMR